MSIDILRPYLKPIADAIRAKKGTNETINAQDFATEIANLPSNSIELQSKTVSPTTSTQTVTADSGYDGLDKVTVNAMPTATQATPSIRVSTSGLITASATQTAGYVSAGTKSNTRQLTTKSATTYTPSTSNVTINSGTYLTGVQTIKGDSNLIASNIKKGVSIFGVNGSYEGSGGGGGASGETCTGTIRGNGPMGTEGVLYYTDGSSTSQEIADVGTISVVKNSFIVANGKGMIPSFSGSGISVLYDSSRMIGVWFVTGDFTIKI